MLLGIGVLLIASAALVLLNASTRAAWALLVVVGLGVVLAAAHAASRVSRSTHPVRFPRK